jgi:hypothetical protein
MLVAVALVALAGCSPPRGAEGPGSHKVAEIPITRVVLYQNGVGYFERRGRLEGDVLTLQIRPSQINDLLKSLTVIDRSDGRAVSVSLPLDKTGAQVLSELPPQVRAASGLLDVLRVFRGARIRVHGSLGEVAGRIVGVENMQQGSTGEDVEADWRLTIKTRSNELRIYPVKKITRIDLSDRTLSVGLDQSLDVSLGEGNWKPIQLSVWLVGGARHDLQASYIVEMPRWKPAYRLVVGDDGLLLQGWAVVDNVSGEDWNDVQLSLVSGTPMSFIYDLHSPQFTRRPDLSPRGRTTAMAPPRDLPGRSTADRLERAKKDARRSKRSRSRSGGGAASGPAPAAPEADEDYGGYGGEEIADMSMEEELEREQVANVAGAKMGALFRYDLTDPVTVPDRSSTLVAIVNKRVAGKEVVLFRPEMTRGNGSTNPYRAVMFENDSGFTLEKGPVTIYSSGTFVGEGFVERMEKGTTAFVTFSIDGNVSLTSKYGNRQEGLRLLKIIDGQIVSEVLQIQSSTYQVANRHETPITAFVKTPRRTGWKLRGQPADTVTTPDALMVPVAVAGAGKGELKVEWVKKVTRRVGIDTSMSTSLLRVYLESGKAPPAIAKQLKAVLEIKRKIGDLEREVRHVEKLHRDLEADQKRVRHNLRMLGKTKGNVDLRRELEQKLGNQERELGRLSARLVRASEERAGLDKKLVVLIRSVTLDAEE